MNKNTTKRQVSSITELYVSLGTMIRFFFFYYFQLLQSIFSNALSERTGNITIDLEPNWKRYLHGTEANNWQQLGESVRGAHYHDLTGHSVCVNNQGNIVAISSPKYTRPQPRATPDFYNNDIPSGRVAVYKYEPISDQWLKLGRDILGEEFDELGTSLAMDATGQNIVVGMINDNVESRDVGSVRVFMYDDQSGEEIWIQKGPSLVGRFNFENFGAAVDISNNGRIIAIGAPKKDVKHSKEEGARWEKEVGVVGIFKYEPNSNIWVKMGGDIQGEGMFDHFGAAVSLSGNGFVVAVGAPKASEYEKGSVNVYRYDNTVADWKHLGGVEGARFGDHFGASVSLSMDGAAFIAGAPDHDVLAHNNFIKKAGHARAFKYEDDKWLMLGQSILGTTEGEGLGTSVSMSNDRSRVAVGSPQFSEDGKNSGSASVYFFDGDKWDLPNDPSNDHVSSAFFHGENALDEFGRVVALSGEGNTLVVGALGGGIAGYTNVYEHLATKAPTMSPTTMISEKHTGDSWFLLVIIILAILACGVIAMYRIYHIALRNKNIQHHVPVDEKLEMNNEAEML